MVVGMNSELYKEKIFKALADNHQRIKSFGVKKIGLFGSVVRHEEVEGSDLDFLVEFEPDKKTFRNYMDLLFFLEDTFSSEIDLITVESLSPYLGPHITKEVEYATIGS
jgi:predicted nucleotidyltransferase